MSAPDLTPPPSTGAPELDVEDEPNADDLGMPDLTFEQRSSWPWVLDLGDLAGVFKLPSRRAARELVRRHGIPHIKLGGRIFVRRESLQSRLGELEVEQAQEKSTRPPPRMVRRRAKLATSGSK